MAKTERFIATIALEDPAEVASDTLVAKLERMFPILENRITSVGAERAQPGSNLLKIDETIVTVIPVATPAPPDAFAQAIRTDRLWPEAQEELGRHQAILIVSHLGTFNDLAGAFDAAVCTTMIVMALLEMTPAIGLYWHAAETVTPADRAKELGIALARGELPLEIWTKMHWFRGPLESAGSQPAVGVLVAGLEPFVGRDLELLPSHADPQAVAQRAIDITTYLLHNGPVLKDGDTADVSDGAALTVKLAMSGHWPRPLPVFQITERTKQ